MRLVPSVIMAFLVAASVRAGTNGVEVGVAGFPVIMSSPETGMGGGAGAIFTFRRDGAAENRPDSLSAVAIATEKKQTLLILSPEIYLDDEAWRLKVTMLYRVWPDLFYGIGNDTLEDDEEEFEIEDLVFRSAIMVRAWSALRLGLLYDWKRTTVNELDPDGQLQEGTWLGTEGADISGMAGAMEWDTRDNIFFPTRGSWLQCEAGVYSEWFGGDEDFRTFIVDMRKYFRIDAERVLALQAYSRNMSGDITFNELAQLETMRGIPDNRFRDKHSLSFRGEYRFPLSWRFSGVAFGSTGSVFDKWAASEVLDLKYAGGLGLRYRLNAREGINLRFDIGISEEGAFSYIQMLEAF